MGYNTSITICNDNLADYEHHPDRFMRIVREGLIDGSEESWGVTVHPSRHADDTQLIAVGQNFSTRVHVGCFLPPHHKPDGQVELLRQWAEALGYDIKLRRKP